MKFIKNIYFFIETVYKTDIGMSNQCNIIVFISKRKKRKIIKFLLMFFLICEIISFIIYS